MKKTRKDKRNQKIIYTILILLLIIISYIYNSKTIENNESNVKFDLTNIPEYKNEIYIDLNDGKPYFEENEYTTQAFEKYSELDNLGRCGVAYANICKEIMPKENEKRESISNVKPTGWIQTKYDGKYLFNRCHLIGYQLAGENANKLNLITGTEYFNVNGMLPFENRVAEYIKINTNNHVLYRVTPIYLENNLVANGVEIEASSVEDNGQGVNFNVYIYNVQPGITIDYKTGKSWKKN